MGDKAREKIILALDTSDIDEAQRCVDDLWEYVVMFKVGYEFLFSCFTHAFSPDISAKQARTNQKKIRALLARIEGKIFLDAKLHDIPRTVRKAIQGIASGIDIRFFTVHALAGFEAMAYTSLFKQSAKMLAVGVLTSLNERQVKHLFGAGISLAGHVTRLLSLAKEAGADGAVVSPLELPLLQGKEWDGFIKVAAGIRPEWAPILDQKRYATAKEAIQAGADYLIIGSPITHPPKEIGGPHDAVLRFIDDISEAL